MHKDQLCFTTFTPYTDFLITASVAARQYEVYGYVSAEVVFLAGAHYLYANACAKGEHLIITSW